MRGAQLVRLALVVVALSLCMGASAQVSITFSGWEDNRSTAGGYWGAVGVAGSAVELEADQSGEDLEGATSGGACGCFDIEGLCEGMGLSGSVSATARVLMSWNQTSSEGETRAGASTDTIQIATLAIDYPTQTLATDTTGEVKHSTLCDAGTTYSYSVGTSGHDLSCGGTLSSEFSSAKAKLFLSARSHAKAKYESTAAVDVCETQATSFACEQ